MRICDNCKLYLLPEKTCLLNFESKRKTDSCSSYKHDECWKCRYYITDTERCRIKGTPTKDCGQFKRKVED